MAYKDILTYGAKVSAVEQAYLAPSAVVPPNITVPITSVYAFLSKVDPWTDENDPELPLQTQQYIKQTFKNMFVAKHVTSNDVSPVIQRIDWTTDTVYSYYRDDIDMFLVDTNDLLVNPFYVKNKYDQVFKCLWNNNGAISTVEPYFEPGTYGTNNIFHGADGYKWKFMYVIDSGLKLKFMDKTWIPVPVGANTPNPLINSAGSGNIDAINVLDGGTGYDPANSAITVTITGDGTGAVATIGVNEVVDGVIKDVIVLSTGKDYSYANVSITSSSGANATFISPASPIGGHGFDPISELGCTHVMYSIEFNGNENDFVPTDIMYHQMGIVINPTTKQLTPNPANGSIYKTSTDLVLAPGFGQYTFDEKVFQGDTLDNATFVGTVLSYDTGTNVVKLINTTGTLVTNSPVYGDTSKTARTLLTYSTPNFVLQSGHISYIENRTGIQRSTDGIEQFKIVIGY